MGLLDLVASLFNCNQQSADVFHIRKSDCCDVVRIHTHLFLQPHHLEPLKVGQVPSPVLLRLSLGERALTPFLIDLGLLPRSRKRSGAGGAGEVGDNERSEGDVREGDGLARDNLVLVA